MNQEIMKELQEIEEMVAEARQHDEYKEKVFYVREGMLKLTGDVKKAILLSSLIGWTEHWLRTDNEVYKQIQEAAAVGDLETIKKLKNQIRQGWFYKSYEDMANDLLKMISKSTAERYCNEFEKKGFISSREPDAKATYRARWYKANIDKIREELNKLGYDLDHFKRQKTAYSPISQNGKSQNTGVSEDESPKPQENRISQNGKWTSQNGKWTSQSGKLLSYNTSFISSSFNTEGDDDGEAVSNEWENDFDYLAFRKRFVDAGADDIFDHKTHYPRFKECLTAIGYAKLIEYAEKYIADNKENSQICWFLGGGWKRYLPKKTQKAIGQTGKLPKAVAEQLKAEKEQATTTTLSEEELAERRARIQAKMKYMNETLSQSQRTRDGFDPIEYDPFYSEKIGS